MATLGVIVLGVLRSALGSDVTDTESHKNVLKLIKQQAAAQLKGARRYCIARRNRTHMRAL